jgi:hypothetical protein
VRIYPNTPLAGYAREHGFIAHDDNLLRPTFYLEPDLREWLPATAASWASQRPNCLTD